MKREDVRKAYDQFSSKASDISRQLSLAGIAIIWIFRVGEKTGGVTFSNSLLLPLGAFTLALALDLAHYVYGSLAWSIFNRVKEKQGVADTDVFRAPPWINWPSIAFFYAKVTVTVVAYIYVLWYIWRAIAGPLFP